LQFGRKSGTTICRTGFAAFCPMDKALAGRNKNSRGAEGEPYVMQACLSPFCKAFSSMLLIFRNMFVPSQNLFVS